MTKKEIKQIEKIHLNNLSKQGLNKIEINNLKKKLNNFETATQKKPFEKR